MKRTLNTLIGMLSIGAMLPAIAGPEWQLTEQARKDKHSQSLAVQQVHSSGGGTTDRDMHMEKMMKECTEMMKKS